MRLNSLRLDRYGVFEDISLPIGAGLTVVVGVNEAGKSTALRALADLLWGIPQRHHPANLVPRNRMRLGTELQNFTEVQGGARNLPSTLVRTGRGLRGADGLAPATNPWGTDGEDDRRTWLTAFGLSQETLRDGGRQVCRGTGDLAELVFTARQGRGVRDLLDDLERRADLLYKDHRGNRSVQIRAALTAYQAQEEALRAAIVRSSDVVAAGDRVGELIAQRAAAVEAETLAAQRVTRLAEHRRCLDHVRRIQAVRHDLAATRVGGPALDEDALTEYDGACAAHDDAEMEHTRLTEQIAEWTAQRDALTVETALLTDGNDLDNLHAELAARDNDRERGAALRAEAERYEQVAQRELEALVGHAEAGELGRLWETLHIPADLAAQLDAAVTQRETIEAACSAACDRLAEERAALESIVDTAALPSREAVAPLAEALALLETEVSPIRRLREAQGRVAAAHDRCRRALLEAEAPDTTMTPPTPPDPESIQTEAQAFDAANATEQHAAERLNEALRQLATERQGHQHRADGDEIVDPERLGYARDERNTMWHEIRRSWLEGVPPHGADAARLADAYQDSVATGDRLADQLREHADEAARAANLKARIAEAQQTLATRQSEYAAARAEHEAAEQAWNARWAGLRVPAPTTSRAAVVQQALTSAACAHSEACAAQETATAAIQEATAWARRLNDLLAGLDVHRSDQVDAVTDLEALIEATRALLNDVDAAREIRQRHQTARETLAQAEEKAAAADRAIAKWEGTWQDLISAAGLAPVTDVTGWTVRRDRLAAAHQALTEAGRLGDEANALCEAWDMFASRAAELGQRHGATGDTAAMLRELWQRLNRSRADQGTHAERVASIATAQQQLAQVAERLADARSRLAALHQRYELCSDAEITDAVDRGRQLRELTDEEAAILGRLRDAVDPGHDPNSIAESLSDADADDLDVEWDVAEAERQQASDRREQIVRELGAAQQQHDTLQRDGDAAVLHARAQEKLAELAELTEQYAVLHLQRLVLREQLESYARQHASPLLDAAGRLLEQFTGGRWVALHAADDGAGTRSLTVVRGDGEPFTTSELSEGTADQVFLALRVEGILQRQRERMSSGRPPLPVVFDDVLVAFDDYRARTALQTLARVCAENPPMQVIVFTHHDHIAAMAGELDQDQVSLVRLDTPAALADRLDPAAVRAAGIARAPVAGLATLDDANAGPRDTTRRQPIPRTEPRRDIDSSRIRAWAKANGIEIGDRGRIPADVTARYLEATGES